MEIQISNKALSKALAVRDLNVCLFKDEIGMFFFYIKTGSDIDTDHKYYITGHGKKFSDYTPAKWADMIVETIATEVPEIADPETTETPESAPLQNEPELQAEINDKLHEAFEEVTLSPMMKQFNDLKAKHPDAVLLFRCGDFYETYCEDAKVASEILGITLTRSSKDGINMAGFPAHALDMYLPKLVRAGKRIAICDQLEDPKKVKTLPKREVTDLVTPAPKAETTPEVAPDAPVSTPTEPEKPSQKAKDKVVKSLDEQKADILEKLGKQIQNMYRKFNVTASHHGNMIMLFMRHVDDTNELCHVSLNVFADGEIKVYTSAPEVFKLESSSIQMEFYLRLNFLLKDGGRQAKVREYVKNALKKIANLDKELVA